MPPPAASGTTHRGLYITLGALIVLVVLVVAGFSAPRWFKTGANSGAQRSSANSSSSPAAPEAAKPEQSAPAPATAYPEQAPAPSSVEPLAPAPAVPEPSPADNSLSSTPSYPAAAGAKTSRHAKRPSQSEISQQPAGDASAQAAQAEKAQLEALDQEMDQLSSREIAISASLDALSKQQNAQGMHLRGDMVEAQARMRMYLGKAQSAIQAQDVKSARKYLDLAEPEIERLEKFLGR
jgi:hypothetical protein